MPNELLSLLAEIFDVEPGELVPETTFKDLLADEYDFEEIAFNLEEMYGIKPDAKTLQKLPALQDLADYIREKTV